MNYDADRLILLHRRIEIKFIDTSHRVGQPPCGRGSRPRGGVGILLRPQSYTSEGVWMDRTEELLKASFNRLELIGGGAAVQVRTFRATWSRCRRRKEEVGRR